MSLQPDDLNDSGQRATHALTYSVAYAVTANGDVLEVTRKLLPRLVSI